VLDRAASRPVSATRRLENDPWVSARAPWALHSVALLGNLTHGWIDVQVTARDAFDSRLVGLITEPNAVRRPYWLVARDRADSWLAYKGMYRSAGWSLVWLARRFAANPPSVVHAHYGTAAAFHHRLAHALGAPFVASFYGYDATMRRFTHTQAWRRRYGRLFDRVDAVLAEGPAMAGRVAGLGCPAEKVHVVPLPVDDSVLSQVDLEAFARALKGRDARLLMLGGGELEADLRRLVAAEGIEGQVDWSGLLDFRRFTERLATGSVAVYASRQAANGDSDGGAPVTLLESQWLGIPSVVADHDDLPHVMAPDGGLVVPSHDVDGWADALLANYEDDAGRRARGAASRRFVLDRHSTATNARLREAVYANLR
jgi:colanic acid/amylovoran/stewartan biosynthesis glycosyltransferase WcaL/AmsK/CpsK